MEKEKLYPIVKQTLSQIEETYKQLLKILTQKKFSMDNYGIKRFLGKSDKLIERIQTHEKLLKNTLNKIVPMEENESVYQKSMDVFPEHREEIEALIRSMGELIDLIQAEQKKIESIFLEEKAKISQELQVNKNKNLINTYKMTKKIVKGKFINKKP